MAIQIDKRSLMSLFIQIYRDESLISTATSFVINNKGNYFLITNRHNVTGRNTSTNECLDDKCTIPNKIRIFYNTNLSNISWSNFDIKLYSDDQEVKPTWLEHPKFKNEIDVVAFKLESDILNHISYELTHPQQLQVSPSDQLNIVGYPFGKSVNGYFAIWTTGFLASDFNLDYDDLPLFLLDSRTRKGQSGSPVIALRSKSYIDQHGNHNIITSPIVWLYGIYSGRINSASDIGRVWKLSAIKELVENPIKGSII